jgi:hypothetical protein
MHIRFRVSELVVVVVEVEVVCQREKEKKMEIAKPSPWIIHKLPCKLDEMRWEDKGRRPGEYLIHWGEVGVK